MSLKSSELKCHCISQDRLGYAEVTKSPTLSYLKSQSLTPAHTTYPLQVSKCFCSLELFRDPVEGDPLPTFAFVTAEVVGREGGSSTSPLKLCLKSHTSHLFIFHWPKQGLRHTYLPDAQKEERTGMFAKSLDDPCSLQSNNLESWKGSERSSPPDVLLRETAFLQFVDCLLVLSLC